MKKVFLEYASRNSLRDRFIHQLFNNVSSRCDNPEDKRFQSYGDRGIQNLLNFADLESIYERDRPDLMIRPSLDRVDNDGHYELRNCRFIEMRQNWMRKSTLPKICTLCGVAGLTRKRNGRFLCPDCFKAEQCKTKRYPRFVQHAIDAAQSVGLSLEPVIVGSSDVASTLFCVGGIKVKIRCCRNALRTAPNCSQRYWRFQMHLEDPTQFIIFVARHNFKYRFFIIPTALVEHEHWVYIPVRRNKFAVTTNWYEYEDAWHLLASANEMSQPGAA